MYLTAQDIAASRDRTLNVMLGYSSTCLETSQRLTELLLTASRDSLQQRSRHWSQLGHGQWETACQFPATLWLETSNKNGQFLDQWMDIVGDAHKSLIRSTEAQIRALDQIIFASLRHSKAWSPWEAEIVLDAMKASLAAGESSLHSASTAALERIERAEQEGHQIAANFTEKPVAGRRSSARRSDT